MPISRVKPEDSPRTPVAKAPDPRLGNDPIPQDKYLSPEFMQLEWDRMWTRVWLIGGRECDIPEPGDYICTDIGPESVLIVRQENGGIRAFYNVCQHRGNILREEGMGHADSFKCAYHFWEYNTDGTFRNIPDLKTFPQGKPPCTGLEEIPCDTFASFIFFNLNPDAEPLRDFLGELPEHLEPYHFERMAQTRDITVEWDCNWKTSVDAFNESYHVHAIHPQLLWYMDDEDIQIDCYEKHSRYLIGFGVVSPRVTMPSQMPPFLEGMMRQAGMDPAAYRGKINDVRPAIQKFKRENGAAQGRDYSDLNDDQLTDDYHYCLFPHVTMNTHADDLMLFRQRPHATDPNKMYFDIWTFELIPDGQDWPERPEHLHYKHGEKSMGRVIDQDAYNLPGVQKGMRSRGFKGLWLGDQELRIRHFHKVLDDYINGPTAPSAPKATAKKAKPRVISGGKGTKSAAKPKKRGGK